jgi:hypothetical protein
VMKLLSSEARNVAAFAISSGLPIRPIGTLATRLAFTCLLSSSVCTAVLKMVVSIGPWHMSRGFNVLHTLKSGTEYLI